MTNIPNNVIKSVSNASFSAKRVKLLILLALLLFVVLPNIGKINPFYSVEFGTVGVVSRFGKIERLASPGLNLKLPFFEKVYFYNTQKIIYETSEQPQASPYYNTTAKGYNENSVVQKSFSDSTDLPVDTTTKDGQQVSIRYTIRYSLDPQKILWIAQNIGTQDQVAQRIVQAASRSITRNVAREFPAQELYTGNVFNYQISVMEKLKTTFEANGVLLDEFLVRQLKFSDGYLAAIEQKQIEQERVKTEEFITQQEEYKKQQKIIKAEGEAKAQEVLRLTIDPLVLRKMAIEKWNGILPTYLGGAGEVPFIGVN